jgi:Lrp/AsnC family leucine-responsive transcriptional regulator
MDNLDKFDRAILNELARDGRVAFTALADRIGLSKTPCMNRIKRLEKQGYITGYQACLDYDLLGEPHITFVQLVLSNTSAKALKAFNDAVSELVEIEQCHMIAGNFDYLLKVRTSNINQYRIFLSEKLAQLPHVAHSSTFVSMETVCDRQKQLP